MKSLRYTNSIAIVIFMWLLTIPAFGQTNSIKKAEKYFNEFLYSEALYIYEGIKSRDTSVVRKWAECYRLLGNSEKSEPLYEQLYNGGNYLPQDLWNYAEVLKMNRKYPEAIAKMEEYDRIRPDEAKIKDHLENRAYYNELIADSTRFKVHELAFNTENDDYGTSYYNAQVVFVSSKPLYTFTAYDDNWTSRRFTNLFGSYDGYTRKGKHTLTKIREIYIRGVMNKKFHEGPATFTTDGLTMIFTRNTYAKKSELDSNSRERIIELWLSKRDHDGTWRNPIPLPINSKKYNVEHPSISFDGHTLYFASNMPGGYGGSDIWYCSITQDGTIGTPVNMGPVVNTNADEKFPFIHHTGILFFASNGHAGLGGLDIFYTRIAHGTALPVTNLGSSINSSKDDFAFLVDQSLKKGFISSNRNGGKGLTDIYGIQVMEPFVIHKTIQGVVRDRDHNDLISGAHVKLLDVNGKELADTVTDDHGFYHFQVEPGEDYVVVAVKDDYREGRKKTSTKPKGDIVTLNLELEAMHVITLECIVTDEETKQGLDSTHLIVIDKATNQTLYDVYTDSTGKWRTVLEPALAFTTINYRIKLERHGYIEKTLDYSHRVLKEEEIKMHEFMDFSLGYLEVGADLGKLLGLNPIYFDRGKFDIRPDAAIELDKIVDVMKKFPDIVIELDSHTDCRSSANLNLILSQKRADASVAYIISKGIPSNRISGKGYGESKLINNCACEGNIKSDCPEDEHAKNRRTEFLIVSMDTK